MQKGALEGVCLLFIAMAACGGALPQDRSSATLHRDLERLVELAGADGWDIDRTEVEDTLPGALLSVCRTNPATRANLKQWLDTQLGKQGGSAKAAYEAHGRDLDEIEDVLLLSRVRLLLARSLEVADADCPFWIHPEQPFRGRQILDDRWLLSVGGGGKAIVDLQSSLSDLDFGGAGRLLGGRAFGRHATILSGIELGGSAAFPQDENGERGTLAITVDAIVPLVYRHRLVNSYWEVEAGYVGRLTEGDSDMAHGGHLGFAFGATASRRRWLFPGAAFGVSYERIDDGQVAHLLKMGFRVAIDIDL